MTTTLRATTIEKTCVVLLLAGWLGINSLHAAQPVVVDGSTLLYWTFDDTAAYFADSSGNERNGTPKNLGGDGITTGASGVLGDSVYLSGTSTESTAWNSIYYKGLEGTNFSNNEFTFQAWIKDPVASGLDTYWGDLIASQRMTSNNVVWTLGIIPGSEEGTVQFVLVVPGNTTGGNNSRVLSDPIVFAPDSWYMVAVVAEQVSEGRSNYTIYIAQDGASELTTVLVALNYIWSSDWDGTPGLYSNFTVGGTGLLSTTSAAAQPTRYQGYIDEVMYSNVARSEAYLLATVIPKPSSAGLVLFTFLTASSARLCWTRRRRVIPGKTAGYTLVELLVVVGVLLILFFYSFAGWRKAVQLSHSVKCLSNLRQLGTAGLQYSLEHRGLLPITDWYNENPEDRMWYSRVAQYVYPDHQYGQTNYYPLFRCPAEEAVRKRPKFDVYRGSNIDYTAIFAAPPKWPLYKPINMSQVEGYRSKVALFTEGNADGKGGPYNQTTFNDIVGPALSRHQQAINVFYCDGAVRRVQNPTWEDLYSIPP